MEPRRKQVLIALAAGVVLSIIGLATKSWFTSSADGVEIHIGINSGESCAGGQCKALNINQMDDNWGLVGFAGLLIGILSILVAGYVGYQIAMRREHSYDPKRLVLPTAAAFLAALIFVLIKPEGMKSTAGFSAFCALFGYAATAAAIFLGPRVLAGAPMGYHQGAQQAGYAPPMAPVRPVQPIQPIGPQSVAPVQAPQPIHPAQPYVPVPGMPQPIQPIMPGQSSMAAQPAAQNNPVFTPGEYAPPTRPIGPGQAGVPLRQPMQPGQPQGMRPMGPMTPSQPVSSTTTIPPGATPCPRCSTGMAWSSQYQRWYCMRCQQYV